MSHIQLNLRLYDMINREESVLYATSYLAGDPKQWFDGSLNDYLTKGDTDRKTLIKRMFDDIGGFDTFEEEIKKMYSEPDKARATEDRLKILK